MSALHWPDHSGSHSRSNAKSNEDSQWAILDAYVPDVTLYIPFRAVIKESLYKSSDGNTEVYRVVLWLVNEDGIHDERVVVCKAAYGARCIDELKKEADIYQRLRALWGDVVPWLYGCYHGQTDSEGLTGVLVLEDCGTPMEHSLDCYSPTCRVLVVNALRRIHQSGIKHCDIASRNIIISKYNNGSIRIVFIDFGASEEHDCPYSGGKIELYSKEPLLDEFKCRELYDVYCEAEVWRKAYVGWYGRRVPIEQASTPEELIKNGRTPRRGGVSPEAEYQYAKSILQDFQEEIELRVVRDERWV